MSAVVQANHPASPAQVLDVEALLTPIPGDSPAGESLQYAGLYDEIRESRRADEDSAQGEWKKSDAKSADWNGVVKLATEALADRTKDLQICAWLTEALVKLHGFVGLRDGLKIMCGLHERFWDHVYPETDEDGLEARANSLDWLSSQLARSIKEVPITDAPTGVNYSYFSWHESEEFDIPEDLDALDAEALERVNELKERASLESKITGEEWRKAKNATRRVFYEGTYALVGECREELRALDRVMDEKFARETPGLGALTKALDEIHTLVEKLVKEKRILEPDPATPEEATDAGGEPHNGLAGHHDAGTTGPIKTRQDAFRRLAEVVNYLRQTEPHSPVSFLVERAIRWGQMPLDLWLEDVIKEGGALETLRETLGLKTTTNGSSSGGDDES